VAELLAQGYLDDARFARRFVEDRRTLDHWGNERIERKLVSSGVQAELVTAALHGAGDDGAEPESQFDAALTTLRGRFRVPPESEKDRNRALGFLVRKGYELEVAYDAIRAYGRD
jgi:regulatory protein